MKKRIISVILAAVLIAAISSVGICAQNTPAYTIKNSYADVVWSGDGAYKAYKGNLHTHSTVSDADSDMKSMILAAYEQGFDFLAFAEHGVTGRAWNLKPVERPFYLYQKILGKSFTYLTDDEYASIIDGSFPLAETGEARGYGMYCVTGANELNAVTMTKSHVNGMFLPENVGNSNWGFENGYEYAVRLTDKNGGISFINHPGDWLESEFAMDAVFRQDAIDYFADIIMNYDSCLGIEVFNGSNAQTRYDRSLWDNLLMAAAPYGETVIGFSNSDAHDERMLNPSFSVFMMPECSSESIRSTMRSGAFFGITRRVFTNPLLGPEKEFDSISDANYKEYPMVSNVSVNGHTVTFNVTDTQYVNWIANGKLIETDTVTENGEAVSINLDDIEGAENFAYVRAEIYGKASLCATQAFMLDNGLVKPEYVRDTGCEAIAKKAESAVLSTRMFVLMQELFRIIKDKIADAFGK